MNISMSQAREAKLRNLEKAREVLAAKRAFEAKNKSTKKKEVKYPKATTAKTVSTREIRLKNLEKARAAKARLRPAKPVTAKTKKVRKPKVAERAIEKVVTPKKVEEKVVVTEYEPVQPALTELPPMTPLELDVTKKEIEEDEAVILKLIEKLKKGKKYKEKKHPKGSEKDKAESLQSAIHIVRENQYMVKQLHKCVTQWSKNPGPISANNATECIATLAQSYVTLAGIIGILPRALDEMKYIDESSRETVIDSIDTLSFICQEVTTMLTIKIR